MFLLHDANSQGGILDNLTSPLHFVCNIYHLQLLWKCKHSLIKYEIIPDFPSVLGFKIAFR